MTLYSTLRLQSEARVLDQGNWREYKFRVIVSDNGVKGANTQNKVCPMRHRAVLKHPRG